MYKLLKLRSCAKCVMNKHMSSVRAETSPDINVTILGQLTPHCRTLAMLLKQLSDIDTIKLYGADDSVFEAAMDLSYIDTDAKIRAFQGGSNLLGESIKDSKIIIICGGNAEKAGKTQEQLFHANVDCIRSCAVHIAEYNPRAIVLIATPPISAFVPLISEEFKKAEVYDPRKIIGLMNTASIRANSFLARHQKGNPTHYLCPVVGGLCPMTTVPVFSQATPKVELKENDAMELTTRVAYGEVDVLEKKNSEGQGCCYFPIVHAAYRFVESLTRAIKGNKNCLECAFVRQTGHIGGFLPYMGTICRLGPDGISDIYMPKLNDMECKLLKKAYPYIKNQIQMGQSCVTGEVFRVPKSSIKIDECKEVVKRPLDIVGDVTVDLGRKYRSFTIYQ